MSILDELGRKLNLVLKHFDLRLNRIGDEKISINDYSYLPKTRSWMETVGISSLQEQLIQSEPAFEELLISFSEYSECFKAIPLNNNEDESCPYWINDWLPGLDAVSIYSLIATNNPSIYFEIGSGISTMFAKRAIEDHYLSTRIMSLDPEPRASIDAICDDLIRLPCEEVPISLFENLPGDMVFFVDSSHRAFQNSDVTVFFTEILPSLPEGCVWGLHDIELPYDYKSDVRDRYYNEQYLLTAYLLGGGGDDNILLPNAFISSRFKLVNIIREIIFTSKYFDGVKKHGTCFWMMRERN
jgi:hypothetical protein